MATFALIHGGGGGAWDWHLVVPELRKRGHEPGAGAGVGDRPAGAAGPAPDTLSRAAGLECPAAC